MRSIPDSLKTKIEAAFQTIHGNNAPKMDIIAQKVTKYLTEGSYLQPRTIRTGNSLGPLDICIRREDVNADPTEIVMFYIEDGTAKVATLPYVHTPDEEFTYQYSIGPAVDVACDFDGRWYRITDRTGIYFDTSIIWALVTFGEPYFARVLNDGSLVIQQGNDPLTSVTLAADNVTKVSCLRGWKNTYLWNHDQGIIVAYIRNGAVCYRNYAQQPPDQPALWELERTITEFNAFGTPDEFTLHLGGATGGSFSLGNGITNTAAIAYNATAATIQSGLEVIYGAGNVTVVIGTNFTITFALSVGASGLVANFSLLTGATTPALTKTKTYAPIGNASNVSVFRTNDYRVGIMAEFSGKMYWVLTDRNWATMAIESHTISATIKDVLAVLIAITYSDAYHKHTISAAVTEAAVLYCPAVWPQVASISNPSTADTVTINIACDLDLYGDITGLQAAFTVRDSAATPVNFVVSATAKGATHNIIKLTVANFEGASGNLTVSYTHNTAPIYSQVEGGCLMELASFSTAFTPLIAPPEGYSAHTISATVTGVTVNLLNVQYIEPYTTHTISTAVTGVAVTLIHVNDINP